MHTEDGCLLHEVLIDILLYVNGVVLLASFPESFQRQLDALASFYIHTLLNMNPYKTKFIIFNTLRFFFKGSDIEITIHLLGSPFHGS